MYLQLPLHNFPFPLEPFPDPIRDFLESASTAFNLDPAIIALPMLTVAGAAIGNSRRIQLTDDHSLPPNLWSAILSPDNPTLSRIRRLILSPLIDHHESIADYVNLAHSQYSLALDDWNNLRREFPPRVARRHEPLPPRSNFRQYFFTDPDFRNLPDYLTRQPRGCLLIQDDLSHWLKSTPLQCLSLFDAPPFTFDRAKSLRARFAPHAFLAITGSISPGLLHDPSPDSTPIRLASHFLFACSTNTTSPRPTSSIDSRILSNWSDLITRLFNLDPTPSNGSIKPILLPLHRKAAKELNAAHDRLSSAAANQSNPRLRAHLLNQIQLIPRLALILQLSTSAGESSPDFVDAFSIASAANLIEYYADELKRIYLDLALDSQPGNIPTVVTLIARRGGSITGRELQRSFLPFRNSASNSRAFLQTLAKEGLGHLTWDSHDSGRTPTFHLHCRIDSDSNPRPASKTHLTVTTKRKKSR
jgi:hypothetical protein